ncbi:MAG: hypothetical protein CFE31_03415 [Rhizobiales bacterium PAR1]|nr:MAG: hypothetical protein CFE31_03415 [Rhizobiales bacterium PAR1]
MMGNLGMVIELIVVGLLCVTIGYCMLLDRRLRAMRQDEQVMRKTVLELGLATERAERAIDSLRHTLGDCDRTLAERLRVAERYTSDLEEQIRSGDDILNRISRIVTTSLQPVAEAIQPPPPRGLSRMSQTLAAAQALAEQAQTRAVQQRDNVA